MAKRQSPLTKSCLLGLLDLYGPMSLREVGGYDTGVHFRFDGSALDESADIIEGRRHCGRLVSRRGFESEVLTYRNRRRNSIEDFFARVEARRANLERWMQEHAATRAAEGSEK